MEAGPLAELGGVGGCLKKREKQLQIVMASKVAGNLLSVRWIWRLPEPKEDNNRKLKELADAKAGASCVNNEFSLTRTKQNALLHAHCKDIHC